MDFELARLTRKDRYKLIAGLIVPRPIALVTTIGADGRPNAAPFSAFNYMSEDPPIVALGLQVHPDGSPKAGELKDTARNIKETGEFVVHLVDEALAPAMVVCAADWPSGVNEAEAAGLTLVPSISVKPPRIREAPAAMECRRAMAVAFSAFRTIVLGEVLRIHVRDELVDPKTLHIDHAAYHAVGRTSGPNYVRTRDGFALPIPAPGDLSSLGRPLDRKTA